MTHQPIADEFPSESTFLLDRELAAAYRALRKRAIRLEAASLRVAGLADLAGLDGIGPVMLARIVEEAQAALKP